MAKYFVVAKDGSIKSKHVKIFNAGLACIGRPGYTVQDKTGKVLYPY